MTNNASSPAKIDGRRLRSDRSRQLIVESMLQLIKEGNLVPTAQQVADHAKVGIRSVFRHFEDMEAIFATADDLWRKNFDDYLVIIDPQLSVSQRISVSAEHLGNMFEAHSNILKSTATRRWRSNFLKQKYASYQEKIRNNLRARLPELETLSPSKQEAIIGILSFEYWDRLREHQSLSTADSIKSIIELLSSLLGSK